MKIPFIDNIAKRFGYSKEIKQSSPKAKQKRVILPWDDIPEGEGSMNYFAGEAPARASKQSLKAFCVVCGGSFFVYTLEG